MLRSGEKFMSENNGNNTSLRLKTGLAEMLKGGVIMDVMSVEQAEVAEKAGATAVMALERVPAIIRAKGEAGTGDVVHSVKHMRQIVKEMRQLTVMSEEELFAAAKNHQAPYELVRMVAKAGKLPVPNFSAGGIATPADAALMMQLGAETVFVGSGIFMKERATPLDVENDPKEREEAVSRARAIVIATTHFNDPKIVAEASEAVIGSMKGLAAAAIEEQDLMQTRGW